MKEAFRSLVHIAAIAALTLLVAIAVIALLMATGCSEVSRDERPSIFILDGGEVEQTITPVPLSAQALKGQHHPRPYPTTWTEWSWAPSTTPNIVASP